VIVTPLADHPEGWGERIIARQGKRNSTLQKT